jgi:uncharacterized protein (DUF736 family)
MNDTANTQEQQKVKDIEIGALWTKTSKAGQKYLSGKIEIDAISALTSKEIKIVAFPNSKKSNEKQPDLRIYVSRLDFKQSESQQTRVKTTEPSETEDTSSQESKDVAF